MEEGRRVMDQGGGVVVGDGPQCRSGGGRWI